MTDGFADRGRERIGDLVEVPAELPAELPAGLVVSLLVASRAGRRGGILLGRRLRLRLPRLPATTVRFAERGSGDGLRKLRDLLGDAFVAGAATYTGARTYTYEDRLHVMPIDRLWRES